MKRSPHTPAHVRRLLNQLADLAVIDADRIHLWPEESIHALRVRMKKLRAVLLLAADGKDDPVIAESYRLAGEIKDGIAGARDAVVIRRTAARHIRGRLPLRPIIPSPSWSIERTLRETARLQKCVRALRLHSLTSAGIAQRFEQSYRRARKAMRKCRQRESAAHFHNWRKRVKVHYYQCLAMRQHRHSARTLRAEARLSKKLGREHDLTLLSSHLAKSARSSSRAIRHQCDSLHRWLLRHGKRIFQRGRQGLQNQRRARPRTKAVLDR